MNIDMSQFYQVFYEEAAEHLANMEGLLLALDVDAPNLEDLNAIFRAAHSIKGGSGTFGFTDITDVTHILETLLDRVRKQELALTPEMVDAFLAAGDVLKAQLAHHQGGPEVDVDQVREVCARLEALSAPTEVNAGTDTRYWVECALSPEIAAEAEAVNNLLAALAEVASCDVRQRPSAESPRLALWASTRQGEAALREILGFYGYPEDIRIQPDGPSAAYGLFAEDESAPKPEAEPAYGFFDDAAGVPPPTASSESEAGYGFFHDAPGAPASKTAQAAVAGGEGFGFFADAPGTPAAAPEVPSAAVAPPPCRPAESWPAGQRRPVGGVRAHRPA